MLTYFNITIIYRNIINTESQNCNLKWNNIRPDQIILHKKISNYMTKYKYLVTFRILSNATLVTVLQWDFTGELLLIADESGHVKIYKSTEHLLNDWQLASETAFQGEHILAAAFFHSGKKVTNNF